MPLWMRLFVVVVIAASIAAAIWAWVHQPRLVDQWDSFQVGRAESYAEAAALIGQVEQAPRAWPAIRELCHKWGTGNQRFDLYLADYVRRGPSSEPLRKAFSLELTWRPDQLPRWRHYWLWQLPAEADARIASMVAHYDLLSQAEPPRSIAWREVLDLQALFEVTGQRDLANRLKPDNWRSRYARWREACPDGVPPQERPELPLPDWEGPPPDASLLVGER